MLRRLFSRHVAAVLAPFALALPTGCDAESGEECACAADETCVDGACEVEPEGPLEVDGRFPQTLPPGYELVDLGEVEVVSGETADLSVDVDGDVNTFFVVAVGRDNAFVQPLSVVAPDGADLVSPQADVDRQTTSYFAGFPGPATSPNRVLGRPRAAAAMVPNTPALALTAGTYTFRVGAYRHRAGGAPADFPLDTTLRVGVVLRRAPVPAAGVVDLVVSAHLSSGLDAATAPDDGPLQDAIVQLDDALREVGLAVGEVAYRDLAGELEMPLDLGGPSCLGGDVPRVFDLVEPAPNTIQLVLIDAFTCVRDGRELGAGLAAISNGVPGLPFAGRDGLVVGTSLKDDFPYEWSLVLAHEVGHYLGLFHTAEAIPGITDNVPDTVDASADDYLMYFDVGASRSILITPDQGSVLRRSPLVRDP